MSATPEGWSVDPFDLGAVLRSLRRQRDLSQRSLAARAGVPVSTIARIESGEITDPRFRTVERLLRAAGTSIRLDGTGEIPSPVPHERITNAAGRHFPAHLDVRATFPYLDRDYRLRPPGKPVHVYELDRAARDARRVEESEVAALRIDCFDVGGGSWRWLARTGDGTPVGQLTACDFPREEGPDPYWPDVVLCDLAVAPRWRHTSLAGRLLDRLWAELAGRRPTEVVTVTHGGMAANRLRELGFECRSTRAFVLMRRAGRWRW